MRWILFIGLAVMKDPPNNNIRMIEFFSGIGGMRLAVEQALSENDSQSSGSVDGSSPASIGLASCQAYDISLHANRCYQYNFIDDNSIRDDKVSTKLVEQLKPKELDGKADLWTMSPPCQPFTGTRGSKGLDMEDKRCHGLQGIMNLLTEIQQKPKWIFLENVKGFATSRMCQAWKDCLQQNGYAWKEYLLSPVQLGIPNHRLRYYIMCERDSTRWSLSKSIGSTTIYEKPPAGTPLQERFVNDYIDNTATLRVLQPYVVEDSILEKDWAKDLGIVAGRDTATRCFTAGYGRILSKATGSVFLFRDCVEDANDGSDFAAEIIAQRAIATEPIDRSDMTQYRGRLRRFTPMELSALFGFPSKFTFPKDIPVEHHYKLIGNSINISVVAVLLKELLAPLTRSEMGTAAVASGTMVATDSLEQQEISDGELLIGGMKGHVEETISGNLLHLYQIFRWKPLPNCTGRYTCREHKIASPLPPLQLLNRVGIRTLDSRENENNACATSLGLKQYAFDIAGRPDRILVVPLDTHNRTGIITYEKSDGNKISYVHTLNSPSGFRRKLEAVGFEHVTDDIIAFSKSNPHDEDYSTAATHNHDRARC